jgi:hypothetical protein
VSPRIVHRLDPRIENVLACIWPEGCPSREALAGARAACRLLLDYEDLSRCVGFLDPHPPAGEAGDERNEPCRPI